MQEHFGTKVDKTNEEKLLELVEVIFWDFNSGKRIKIYKWGNEYWLVYWNKGYNCWTSWRKPTDDDINTLWLEYNKEQPLKVYL